MQGQYLILGSAVVIALIIVIVILHFVKKIEMKYYRGKVKNLEIQRNMVASTPVLVELSKVEPIIKNDKTYVAQDNKCIGCGICSGVCPRQAWEMKKA